MKRTLLHCHLLYALLPFTLVAVLAAHALADQPILQGYADYETFRRQLESIATSNVAALTPLARTRGGREVYLLRIGAPRGEERPAILVLGSVHPPHLLGSELAVRLARRLVEQAATDKAIEQMLRRVTFYIIPRPSPDACEAFFRRPYWERAENQRKVDDDRDGAGDEDGPEDLNGDGLITMMRVEDPAGVYRAHEKDARVLVKADPQRNERGRCSLYVEGRDNDGDELHNEDPPGGTAFNRNFTFRYPFFQRGGGPHQVSEEETRAVADFAFSHPNIAVVFSFTPEDNLMRPWKPSPAAESQRIKTSVLAGDAAYFGYVAQQYQEILAAKQSPESPAGQGSFSEWAYFHYGRWSFACRGWWIPPLSTPEAKSETKLAQEKSPEERLEKPSEKENQTQPNADSAKPERSPREDVTKPEGKKPPTRTGGRGTTAVEARSEEAKPGEDRAAEAKRAAEDLGAVRWFDQNKIDGFVPWQRVAHPDFPGRTVEVGGFRPFLRLNPPAGELDGLADRHWRFLCRLAELLPKISIQQVKTEALGSGVWRVTAEIINQGYLPTVSRMGEISRVPHPLQATIELPQGATLVTGHPRMALPALVGSGGKAEQTWLVRLPDDKARRLRLRVWSPSVGVAVKTIKLAAEEAKGEPKP